MEEAAAGAAWPGDEAPISILQCTFPPFDVKMDSLLDGVEDLSQQCAPDNTHGARGAIEQAVRQRLLIDWTYIGAYRAWREATALNGALRALHEQLEQWTAQQIEHMLRTLLQTPGARKDVDVTAPAWVVSLLLWRLAEVPLQEPDTIVATITECSSFYLMPILTL